MQHGHRSEGEWEELYESCSESPREGSEGEYTRNDIEVITEECEVHENDGRHGSDAVVGVGGEADCMKPDNDNNLTEEAERDVHNDEAHNDSGDGDGGEDEDIIARVLTFPNKSSAVKMASSSATLIFRPEVNIVGLDHYTPSGGLVMCLWEVHEKPRVTYNNERLVVDSAWRSSLLRDVGDVCSSIESSLGNRIVVDGTISSDGDLSILSVRPPEALAAMTSPQTNPISSTQT